MIIVMEGDTNNYFSGLIFDINILLLQKLNMKLWVTIPALGEDLLYMLSIRLKHETY